MSRFLAGLGGPGVRREIALSPLVWGAVAASFAIFCVTCLGIAVLIPVHHPVALAIFAVGSAVVSAVLARARRPNRTRSRPTP